MQLNHPYRVALVGNQNCGKTTLFNNLTGDHQHVGNWPGVTVERRTGSMTGHDHVQLLDLPGVYSLSSYSQEETITRDLLLQDKPDLILNVVDATNLERNLYLTLQLLWLGIPVMIALTMMDEVSAMGDVLQVKVLSVDLQKKRISLTMKNI